MKLTRSISGPLSWMLDNLLPPVIRDAPWFARMLMWLLFKNKTGHFIKFKNKAYMLSQEEYEQYYQDLSDVHFDRETDLDPAAVKYILENIAGETVLDTGCGRGYLAKKIALENKVNVTAIDLQLSKELKNMTNPEFIAGNINLLPFPDKKFDTVICTHTLEHVVDIYQVISELRRVCRKKMIVVVPRQRPYRHTFDLHLHFFPYRFSVMTLMNNSRGKCKLIKNDWVYWEDI